MQNYFVFLINLFVTIKTLEIFYVLIHKSSHIPKIKICTITLSLLNEYMN